MASTENEAPISLNELCEMIDLPKRLVRRSRDNLLKIDMIGVRTSAHCLPRSYFIQNDYKKWRFHEHEGVCIDVHTRLYDRLYAIPDYLLVDRLNRANYRCAHTKILALFEKFFNFYTVCFLWRVRQMFLIISSI